MTYDIDDDYAIAEIFNDMFNIFVYEIESCVNKSKKDYNENYNYYYNAYNKPVYSSMTKEVLHKQCNMSVARVFYFDLINMLDKLYEENIDTINKTMMPVIIDSVNKHFSIKYDRKYFEKLDSHNLSPYVDNPLFAALDEMYDNIDDTDNFHHYTSRAMKLLIYKNDNHLEEVDNDIVEYQMLADKDYQIEQKEEAKRLLK